MAAQPQAVLPTRSDVLARRRDQPRQAPAPTVAQTSPRQQGEQARQPEAVVTVQVREQHARDAREAQARGEHALLRALAAVDQPQSARVGTQREGREPALARRDPGRRAEEGELHGRAMVPCRPRGRAGPLSPGPARRGLRAVVPRRARDWRFGTSPSLRSSAWVRRPRCAAPRPTSATAPSRGSAPGPGRSKERAESGARTPRCAQPVPPVIPARS